MRRKIAATTAQRIAEERREMHTNVIAMIMFAMLLGGLISLIPTGKTPLTSETSTALVGHNNATELDDCQVVQTVNGDRFADFFASCYGKNRINYSEMEWEFGRINHTNPHLIHPNRPYLMPRGMEVDTIKLAKRRASRG